MPYFITIKELQDKINLLFNNTFDMRHLTLYTKESIDEALKIYSSLEGFGINCFEIKQPRVKLPDIKKWYMKSRLIDRILPSIDMGRG